MEALTVLQYSVILFRRPRPGPLMALTSQPSTGGIEALSLDTSYQITAPTKLLSIRVTLLIVNAVKLGTLVQRLPNTFKIC